SGGGQGPDVTLAVDPNQIQVRVSGVCASGYAMSAIAGDGTVTCVPVGTINAWSLTGNAGTDPSTNFLGTSDNQPLNLRVNGSRALRLEPGTFAPNLIGGFRGNSVGTGVNGATIGGGGEAFETNSVTASFATVAGGT